MASMNRELVKQWIDALRSGKYKQVKSTLRDMKDDSYCCLGVACLLHPSGQKYLDIRTCDYLPSEMAIDFGIQGAMVPGDENDKRVQYLLAKQNDEGVPFLEIADWIEKEILNRKNEGGNNG
jgi:hypothetical protein